MSKKLTPMMEQYYSVKAEYPGCILFFRLGDFYEMFEEDAVIGAEILDITLTARGKDESKTPMCGVPYHSAEGYIAKLTSVGQKVAICEQVSDPSEPGIVKREVVRVVTPGTNLSAMSLEGDENSFVAGLIKTSDGFVVGFCDVSTGDFFVEEVSDLAFVASLISNYDPREIVVEDGLADDPAVFRLVSEFEGLLMNRFPVSGDGRAELCELLGTKTLASIGIEGHSGLISLCSMVVGYLRSVMHADIRNINRVVRLDSSDSFQLDRTTIYNLEIFHTIRDFDKKNSLLAVIDKTKTAGGGRLLKRFLLRPLKDLSLINERLSYVEAFYNFGGLNAVSDLLKEVSDLERIMSRLSLGHGNPRDLILIKNSLSVLPEICSLLGSDSVLSALSDRISDMSELLDLISKSICDEPPISRRDAGIFRDGYNAEIDELRSLLGEGKEFINNLLSREIERTGISNMKIGYNKVFGYYIEVSAGKVSMVPEDYIRKQTLTNAERYITPELKEYEEKVLNAGDRLNTLEEQLFSKLVEEVVGHSSSVFELARALSFIDVMSSFAELARSNRLNKPVIDESSDLEIVSGRHPVLENIVESGSFVPNDLSMKGSFLKLITGPNMGGKSTYLRQTAIVVLLAQIGCFVPAESARIGLVDQIYSRVGASDNLARGLSTFMVEMEETAYILRQATDKSLLILDEIGRGTSTYDGVSIAWSVIEFIHDSLKARTLFATHYHELIDVIAGYSDAENLSVSVDEDSNGEPVFMHKISQGAIDKSYGVHVAKIAGLPSDVVKRAEALLAELESGESSGRAHRAISSYETPKLFEVSESKVDKELADLDVNQLSPIEALNKLYELKEKLND